MSKQTTVVYVTPLSTAALALEATARTINALVGGHSVRRASDGAILLDNGRLVVDSQDPGFLTFAVKNQGYALAVEPAIDTHKALAESLVINALGGGEESGR